MQKISVIARILNNATGKVDGIMLATGLAVWVMTLDEFEKLQADVNYNVTSEEIRDIILRATAQEDMNYLLFFEQPLQAANLTSYADVSTLLKAVKPDGKTKAMLRAKEEPNDHLIVTLEEIIFDLETSEILSYDVNGNLPKEALLFRRYNSPLTYSYLIYRVWEVYADHNEHPFTFVDLQELISSCRPMSHITFDLNLS